MTKNTSIQSTFTKTLALSGTSVLALALLTGCSVEEGTPGTEDTTAATAESSPATAETSPTTDSTVSDSASGTADTPGTPTAAGDGEDHLGLPAIGVHGLGERPRRRTDLGPFEDLAVAHAAEHNRWRRQE